MQLGLDPPTPAQPSYPTAVAPSPAPAPQQVNIGGIMSMKSLSATLAVDQMADATARALTAQSNPVIQGLVGLLQKHWQTARDAKQPIEQKMLNAVRARRGEYPPEKLTQIRATGGSEIYMLLFATKARQAKALLGDVFIGAGTTKPWTLSHTPKPDLPPETVSQIMNAVGQMAYQAEMAAQAGLGEAFDVAQIREMLVDAKDRAEAELMQVARQEAAAAELEIEDILVEGGWLQALDEFLDDLTTFKTAFIAGPIVRHVPTLEWQAGEGGASKPVVVTKKTLEFERVDPFMMYPLPWATNTDRVPLFRRHQLTRGELSSMIGCDGYNTDAITAVLDAHGANGLHHWLGIDVEKAVAEGRDGGIAGAQTSDLIDALQYWGSVSGKMLREWGMKDNEIPDQTKEYEVECWLIGTWVIKCVLNPDPLGRRPYYSDGYSRIPGAFWHNSLYDLIEDCVDMCNAAARAIANNLGISSGPQVDVNVDRLAQGEKITSMYPWKIWQTVSDPMGSTAKAVNFFQPDSHAQELMAVYEKFSMMADEYSGIPRYMTGTEGTPGAGRTASGLSMMIGNASKTIKQLIGSIDMRVIGPSVSRVYERKIQEPDGKMRGDLKTVARGALSLTTREAAQVRRNEFLQITGNPIDMQIMGPNGRAAVLREVAKTLDMNVDDIVPSKAMMRQKQFQQVAMQQQPQPGGEHLANGAPVTDHFSPTAA